MSDSKLLFLMMLVSLAYINLLSVPLFYPSFFIVVFLFFVFKKIQVDLGLIALMLLLASPLIIQFLRFDIKLIQTIMYIFLSVLAYILVTGMNFQDLKSINNVLAKIVMVFIAIISVDTALRFIFPSTLVDYSNVAEDLHFYKYKISYLYLDSNIVALLLIHLISLRFICASINKEKIINGLNIILISLLILTLSRSCIISLLVLFVLIKSKDSSLFRIVVVPSVIIAIFIVASNLIISDASGLTKLHELSSIVSFYRDYSIFDVLFGIGVGFGEEVTGRYVHGIIPKLLIEMGLIATIFYVFLLLKICKLNVFMYLYLVPMIIAGLSLSFYVVAPYQLVGLAFIKLYLESYENS